MAKKTTKNQKKNNKKIFSLESMHCILRGLSDLIVSGYMALILLVMPFYNQEGFIHIGTDKSTFLRICSTNAAKILIPVLFLYLALGVVLWWRSKRSGSVSKRLRFRDLCLSITDIFALIYGVSILLSYACSQYRGVVQDGESGWYMGTVTLLRLLGSYFAVSRLWKKKDWLTALILPASAVVFLLGLLNRFGVYPFDMQADNQQFISTIGNINWYCGYLTSVFFGGFALLWQSQRMKLWQRALLAFYVAVGFASLVTQGSSSGIFALAVMLILTFILSAEDGKRMCMFWVEVLILSLVCLGIRQVCRMDWGQLNYAETSTEILVMGVLPTIMTIVSALVLAGITVLERKGHYPGKLFRVLTASVGVGAAGSLVILAILIAVNTATGGAITSQAGEPAAGILTFSPSWGSNRGATWSAGIRIFWEQDILHKLVGVGADGMAAYLYTDGSSSLVEMVRGCFHDNRLTNAHNEWITVLVNTGVLGFAGYVGMMVTAMVRFVRQRGRKLAVTACGFCLAAYTANNMFSFKQAMNGATIFILLGIGENYLRAEKKDGKV